MRLLISLVLSLLSHDLCFAEYKFNPKIERKSYYNCGHCPCDNYYWKDKPLGGCSGTMGCCWPIHIYIYPKNIDKMINENPEFKDEIGKDFDLQFDISVVAAKCRESIIDNITVEKRALSNNMDSCKWDSNVHLKYCSERVMQERFNEVNKQIATLEDKITISDELLVQDKICSNFIQNPKNIEPETCYQLWKYDSCGSCSTVEIKSYYTMQQHCNQIIKKVLKKTGKLY